MIEGFHPVLQAFLGTLFTWAMTAAGSALVFVFRRSHRKILDGSLGFAAGVMLAASYWSLLAPAIEMAETTGTYGANGEYAFVPVAVGFSLGALFVFGADKLLPYSRVSRKFERSIVLTPDNTTSNGEFAAISLTGPEKDELAEVVIGKGNKATADGPTELCEVRVNGDNYYHVNSENVDEERSTSAEEMPPPKEKEDDDDPNAQLDGGSVTVLTPNQGELSKRKKNTPEDDPAQRQAKEEAELQRHLRWRRLLLLVIAITVHNIPEGLAVGVGFGAIGKTTSATFSNARNLALGIGIQNFPEGLSVSMPLRGCGFGRFKAFMYGQFSGMVEPIAGVLGALAVVVAEPILPYALAFAAGAMVYVVVDDIIPEPQSSGNGRLASWTTILGFVVMMSLDVALG